VLVAVQVAGSLALVIVAGLFLRSLHSAQHSDLGFEAMHVLNVALDPGEIGYSQVGGKNPRLDAAARIRALLGVSNEITIPGRVSQRGEELHADFNAVSTDNFTTINIALVRGRDLLDSDPELSPRVAVIKEAMAERFWPGVNPVGQSFKPNGDAQLTIEVIGVVRNSRIEAVYSPISSAFYVPSRRPIRRRKPCRFALSTRLSPLHPRSWPWCGNWR
jgi:hypothetical protein